jgi:folylpolyglutamate synthase/dihydropteroate synthase
MLLSVHTQRLGLDKRLDELNVVHVAGTKGKVQSCSSKGGLCLGLLSCA